MSISEAAANTCNAASPTRFPRRRTVFIVVGVLALAAGIRGIAEYAEAQFVKPLPGPSEHGFGSLDVTYGEPATTPPIDAASGMSGEMPPMAISSNTPYPYPKPHPSGVGIHITLADGQTIDLRANDIVLTFPGGGSVRATESGLMPILAPTASVPGVGPGMPQVFNPTPPAIPQPPQLDVNAPGQPTWPPNVDSPGTETPSDSSSGVTPNTGGIQPVERTPQPRLEEQLTPGLVPESTTPR